MNWIDILEKIPKLFDQFFIYIYPGWVAIFMYHFATARKTKWNKETLEISVVLSYVFVLLYKTILNRTISEFSNRDYVALLILAVLIPILWKKFSTSRFFEKFLIKIGINTSVEDTAWDYVQNREKENEGISLKVFLDDRGIMYEGSLRYRVSDPDEEQYICLSGYRRYIKEGEGYVIKLDYAKKNDHSRWVLIKGADITRTEIKYSSDR